MIRFEDVTVTYAGAAAPALSRVEAVVEEGELCLVIGPTGSGKTTLLGAACARVPHFSGGLLEGRVLVAGRDTRTNRPRDLSDLVGVVGQDPLAGFVTDTVEDELAFGLEQLGLPGSTMRKRVEEVLDLLGLAPLRHRALLDLSGGEQQRVALGAVLTAHPRVLVLDEPTSALDPTAAEDVLGAVTRLVHDLGITVLLAEHRLERVVQYADRVIALSADGTVDVGDPRRVLSAAAVAPPVVELGRLAGWDPLPLSVRDARRCAADLRAALAAGPTTMSEQLPVDPVPTGPAPAGPVVLSARGLHVRHGDVHALRGVDLDLRGGEVLAVMGRNGSGKSSLLWALQGQGPRSSGTVRLAATAAALAPTTQGPQRGLVRWASGARRRETHPADPAEMAPRESRRRITLVPQTPGDLLYLESIDAEFAAADAQAGARPGTTHALFLRLTRGVAGTTHPRDLSEGQRLALALAVQLSAAPEVVLLDEPTRGLDYAAKRNLGAVLADLAREGRSVVLASHDVEFVAGWATRVLVLGEGEVVADGAAREVLVSSPTFAPQVAKILHPVELLTVEAVRAALVTS